MPFTLSHAAAALPFRRTRLVFSALVMGTFAPDLEYFLRLRAGGGWGHKISGAFCLSLPLGLIALWLFHRTVKAPATALLPIPLQRRLAPYLRRFQFGGLSRAGLSRFALIVFSLLVGIATHIFWDDFTHHSSFVFHHWALLSRVVKLPVVGWTPYYALLQYLSSIGGIVVLALWFMAWYKHAAPAPQRLASPFSPGQRFLIFSSMATVALLGAMARGTITLSGTSHRLSNFAGGFIITFVALCWWQLVVWGALLRLRTAYFSRASRNRPQTLSS
ncbi:MAG TPA: DUF4184 family protein [Terracidiphilus sp.]|nr:DUF4184 family protein [Terracidiphilus sp.]